MTLFKKSLRLILPLEGETAAALAQATRGQGMAAGGRGPGRDVAEGEDRRGGGRGGRGGEGVGPGGVMGASKAGARQGCVVCIVRMPACFIWCKARALGWGGRGGKRWAGYCTSRPGGIRGAGAEVCVGRAWLLCSRAWYHNGERLRCVFLFTVYLFFDLFL